ncbi:saccharopine dehydrogenase family protein [Hydrogenophaga sp.]|uniref:saccharopine dehydrogenase family protein n=1 Tax=Hydrogenophaga sp. TaxID=1904254 RepID=UPI00271928E5|nr:saccharopine dehydrogenase NADP-binding domain-containing protein [Hydrogenophaga sp.]MDO9436045.1 saccharopine dehydrogenase NADP-binding domain-containing protein [Hydrogenophaga sp.]
MHPLKTLVLGGYGNFGARLSRSLAQDASQQVVVGGRDADRATRMARELGGGAQAVQIDAGQGDLAALLRAHHIDLVIHTAGPFQTQGYAVARACAEAGCHYIDFADGRRFVCDFSDALHDRFVRAGRTAISGASTVPALSSAVVDHLSRGWQAIHTIDICIAPAQTAPRGAATIAGVLVYCGAPVSVWRGGAWQQDHGWETLRRVEFAHMRSRLGALCDVPDLELFPAHYQVRDHVRMEAALEVPLSQRGFSWLATARRRGFLKHPERLAPWLNKLAPLLDPWGSALGGMVVRVSGLDATGAQIQRAWHVTADNSHGPEIPTMPALLLARQMAQHHPMPPGAHTAAGLLPLSAFANEFERWGMLTNEE